MILNGPLKMLLNFFGTFSSPTAGYETITHEPTCSWVSIRVVS
jgi:hypothetical protein